MADGTLIFDTKVESEGVSTGMSTVKKLFTAGMGFVVAKHAVGLAKMGIAYNSQMQDFQSKFKVLLGSATKANKHVAELRKLAMKTPFRTTDLAAASQQLLAFGVNSKSVSGHLRRLGDISLGNKEKFQQLGLVFGQVSSQGKLMGQDLLQFINAGFNPLKELSKMGRGTYQELKDQMAQGKISFQDVQAAIEHATSKGGQFFNGMKEGSKTFAAQVDALKGNLEILAGNAFKPLYNLLTRIVPHLGAVASKLNKYPKIIGAVTTAVTTLTAAMVTFYAAQKWAVFNEAIRSSMGSAMKFFSAFHNSLWLNLGVGVDKIIPGLGTKLLNIPIGMQSAVGKLSSVLGSAGKSIAAFMATPAGIVVAVGAAITALGVWVNKIGGVDKAVALIHSKIAAFKAKIPELIKGIGAGFKVAVEGIKTVLFDVLPTVAKAIWKALPSALSTLGQLANNLGTYLFQKVGQLAQAIATGLPKALQAVITAIPKVLLELFTRSGEGAKQGGEQAGAKGGEGIALGFLKTFIVGMGKLALAIVTALPQIAIAVVSGIVKCIPIILSAVGNLAISVLNAIGRGLGSLVTVAVNWIWGFIEGFLIGAANVINAVWNFAKTLPGKIASGIGSLVSTAINWLVGFASGIRSGFAHAVSAVSSGARSLPGRVRGAIGSLYSIGVHFLQGLVNGIKAGFGKVFSLISSLGSKCKAKLKSVFDIHSPSRFTTWIGRMLIEGMDVGIVRNTGKLLSSIGEQMGLVQDAFLIDAPEINPIASAISGERSRIFGATGSSQNVEVNQTINFNQPWKSPADVSRAVSWETAKLGLAGAQ
jgi:phage tape measure protein|nr:MAG TPA: tail tape measure protein [Caudoviricetes sp.]